MKKFLTIPVLALAAVLAAFTPTPASAALITYSLTFPTPTTWQLAVTDSVGDNAGIFSFGFNAQGISSINFDGPTATFFKAPSSFKTFGFATNLQPGGAFDPAAIDPASINAFKTAQGLSDPSNDYVYSAGQTAGDTNTLAAPSGFSLLAHQAYGVPLLLFDGTRPLDGVVSITSLNGAVFTTTGQGTGANLNITPTIIAAVAPEPASLALIGVGACLTLARRRRSH